MDSDGRRAMSTERLREVYDDLAPRFERFERVNRLLTRRYRRRLFGDVEGRVLDVACGTGANFPYLSETDLVAVDLSPEMIAVARRRAADLGLDAEVREMDAAALDFPDDSFDIVVSSLSTCTFPDPVAALREMARVCRPAGSIRLLEHGRSSLGPVARFQDWRAESHFATAGCRWNQEPLDLVHEADLHVVESRRALAGVLTSVVARPGGA